MKSTDYVLDVAFPQILFFPDLKTKKTDVIFFPVKPATFYKRIQGWTIKKVQLQRKLKHHHILLLQLWKHSACMSHSPCRGKKKQVQHYVNNNSVLTCRKARESHTMKIVNVKEVLRLSPPLQLLTGLFGQASVHFPELYVVRIAFIVFSWFKNFPLFFFFVISFL